jgi:hypothetical protein
VHSRITAVKSPTTIEAAREYLRRGWAIVPVPAGQKAAIIRGWPEYRADPEDLPRLFGTDRGANVAVILGPRSGELVDFDFDRGEGAGHSLIFRSPLLEPCAQYAITVVASTSACMLPARDPQPRARPLW